MVLLELFYEIIFYWFCLSYTQKHLKWSSNSCEMPPNCSNRNRD
jgi:hypothetical protein